MLILLKNFDPESQVRLATNRCMYPPAPGTAGYSFLETLFCWSPLGDQLKKRSPCDPHMDLFGHSLVTLTPRGVWLTRNFRHISPGDKFLCTQVRASNRQLGQDSVSKGTCHDNITEGRNGLHHRVTAHNTPHQAKESLHRGTKHHKSPHQATRKPPPRHRDVT